MSKTRKHYSPTEKSAILREHLIDKVPVSDLCDRHGIHPTLFYQWQKTLFENLPTLFENKTHNQARQHNDQVELLQRKIAHKDEVIAQIMEDFVEVKKKIGAA